MGSTKVCWNLASMDGAQAIEVDEPSAVDDLQIKAASSIQGEGGKLPHLRDIDFVGTEEKEVTILTGCDVPQAHWVMEQRAGAKNPPMLYERSWDGYSVNP